MAFFGKRDLAVFADTNALTNKGAVMNNENDSRTKPESGLIAIAERLPSAEWLLDRIADGDSPYATQRARNGLLSDIGLLLSYVGMQPSTPLGRKIGRILKRKQVYLVKGIIEREVQNI